MRSASLFLLIFIMAASCKKPDPQAQKQHLQGYWEIRKVEMPQGKKDFAVNTVVDFIEVEGDSGMRTKVAPKLDGTFTTNGISENFQLKIEEDSLRMYYTTPYDKWVETVIDATDSTLVVKNRDNKVYSYSKFEKFNLGELP